MLFGIGIAVGAAFFQERILSFFSQEGWNPGAATAVVKEFVRQADAPNGGAAATALLEPAEYDTTVKGGKLVSVNHGKGMARTSTPVKRIVPTGELKQANAELLAMDGGSYRVVVQYANGKWAEYRVRKRDGVRRISVAPELLFDNVPPKNTDY